MEIGELTWENVFEKKLKNETFEGEVSEEELGMHIEMPISKFLSSLMWTLNNGFKEEKMQILKLSFENINSLKGAWTIDFQAPDFRSGIFAIVGPTGSGKTTILDAICLALYGHTPPYRARLLRMPTKSWTETATAVGAVGVPNT